MIGARLILSAVVASFVLSASPALGQTKILIAPPRDISDITAILEQQRPDLASIAALRAKADAEPRRQVKHWASSITSARKPARNLRALRKPSPMPRRRSPTAAST